MTPIQAWNIIISRLEGKIVELPTVPKTKKSPVWFSSTTDGKTIFINKAIDHSPSSKISVQRKLEYNTFQKVYPLFLRRESGEAVSTEVTAVTVNQVYYFSLIKHFC
ncbi:hypothetical protein [Peribacillus alkalitolerans]|uniref:hypothetical protein n=1 Tax=Peribacillus alkalitolerans TaxID=1550385 RepID=UPI0013D7799B|nr:hypothetical protein [Peribacillus alkalitolerans]